MTTPLDSKHSVALSNPAEIIWAGNRTSLQKVEDYLVDAFGKKNYRLKVFGEQEKLSDHHVNGKASIILTDDTVSAYPGLCDSNPPDPRLLNINTLEQGNAALILRMAHENSCLRNNKNQTDLSDLIYNYTLQAHEGVIITNADLKNGPTIIFANHTMAEMTGYSIEEIVGSTPRMFQGPKTQISFKKELKKCCEDGRPFDGTTFNYRKDGTEFDVEMRINPIRNQTGEVTHFGAITRDVTDFQRIQKQLKQEIDYQKEMGKYAKIGGWRYFKNGNATWLSDTVYEIYGLQKDEPFNIEQGISFYKGDSRKQIIDSFNKLLKDGTSYDLVLAFQNTEEKDLWVRTKGVPLYNNDEIVGAWGIMQDVTDMFLLKSEHEFIQTCSSELHIVIRDNKIYEQNDRWAKVFGYEKSEVLMHKWTDYIHPEDKPVVPNLLEMIFTRKTLENIEIRGVHKDGHTVWLRFNAQLAADNETIFAIAQDISHLKQREMELEEALAKTKSASKAKDQFLMMMSHELRTPLNPIIGFSDLLLFQVENEEHRQLIKLIKDSATHLTFLVSDILDVSSIESGKISVAEDDFNLIDVIQSIVGMMQDEISSKGLSLSLNIAADSNKPVPCIGDEKKFRQIVLNILNNAIKFTHEGSITVDLLQPEFSDYSINTTIRVTDTGIGIPEIELERVFEKFHQVQMSQTRKYKGQGLGLALSRELARLMNGDITVESEVGKGSVFTVRLPFKRIAI